MEPQTVKHAAGVQTQFDTKTQYISALRHTGQVCDCTRAPALSRCDRFEATLSSGDDILTRFYHFIEHCALLRGLH